MSASRVTVTALTEDSLLVLRVSDTGAGVDPAHAEAVFQRGFSTKPAGPGGRGLGLALVRQAVARHEGTLTVAEAPGGGAEFEVRLPLPKVAAPTVAASAVTAPAVASANASGRHAPDKSSTERPEPAEPALPGGDV